MNLRSTLNKKPALDWRQGGFFVAYLPPVSAAASRLRSSKSAVHMTQKRGDPLGVVSLYSQAHNSFRFVLAQQVVGTFGCFSALFDRNELDFEIVSPLA